MKKVYIIIFDSEKEILSNSEKIQEFFTKTNDSKVYCGTWGEIQFNKEECLNAISATVNHFIQMQDNKEIYFGCNINDVLDIKPLLALENCELVEVPYCKFIKDYIL